LVNPKSDKSKKTVWTNWEEESPTKVSGEDQNDQVPKTKTVNHPIVLEQQQDQKQMKRHWNRESDELSSPPKPKK
jgi:hypothetical protein